MFEQYIEAIEHNNIVSKTDIDGIITFVNDEFCKISKYSKIIESDLSSNLIKLKKPYLFDLNKHKLYHSTKIINLTK